MDQREADGLLQDLMYYVRQRNVRPFGRIVTLPGSVAGHQMIGPSGSGKTTAMQMVNRLITMTDGDVTIDAQHHGS